MIVRTKIIGHVTHYSLLITHCSEYKHPPLDYPFILLKEKTYNSL